MLQHTKDILWCGAQYNNNYYYGTYFTALCKWVLSNSPKYKKRHDRVATTIHWALCEKYGLLHMEKWHDHQAEPAVENDHVKLLWDFNVQADRTMGPGDHTWSW